VVEKAGYDVVYITAQCQINTRGREKIHEKKDGKKERDSSGTLNMRSTN
jgi:hypothetical protein